MPTQTFKDKDYTIALGKYTAGVPVPGVKHIHTLMHTDIKHTQTQTHSCCRHIHTQLYKNTQ